MSTDYTPPAETVSVDEARVSVESAPGAEAALAPVTTPRTRWAAIVWGLLFAAVAAWGLWILGDDARSDQIAAWASTMTPNTLVALLLLALGVLALVTGAAGLFRHAQRRRASVGA